MHDTLTASIAKDCAMLAEVKELCDVMGSARKLIDQHLSIFLKVTVFNSTKILPILDSQ